MTCEIIQLSAARPKPGKKFNLRVTVSAERPKSPAPYGAPERTGQDGKSRERIRNGRNMHTLLFRSRESILQSDEPDLVRDVCFDIDRAQGKLKRIRARMASLQEYAATELQLLADADAKLSAAIVAALLSTRRGNADA